MEGQVAVHFSGVARSALGFEPVQWRPRASNNHLRFAAGESHIAILKREDAPAGSKPILDNLIRCLVLYGPGFPQITNKVLASLSETGGR